MIKRIANLLLRLNNFLTSTPVEPFGELLIKVPPAALQRLEVIRMRRNHRSFLEVVRHALAVYDLETTHLEEGGTIILKDRNGQEEELQLQLSQ